MTYCQIIDESLTASVAEDDAHEIAYWAAKSPKQAGDEAARCGGYADSEEMEAAITEAEEQEQSEAEL